MILYVSDILKLYLLSLESKLSFAMSLLVLFRFFITYVQGLFTNL